VDHSTNEAQRDSDSIARATVGVVHGRFQVFHRDHLEYVRAASDRSNYLVVGITSPDSSFRSADQSYAERADPLNNPLSYYERARCIAIVLRLLGRSQQDSMIVPFPIEDPARIVSYVPEDAAFFTTIYDEWGREKAQRMRGLGLDVQVLWDDRDKPLSASMVRELMRTGGNWRPFVPEQLWSELSSPTVQRRLMAGV
jgi:nicotinamide mononucleotide adenylyltransferase